MAVHITLQRRPLNARKLRWSVLIVRVAFEGDFVVAIIIAAMVILLLI